LKVVHLESYKTLGIFRQRGLLVYATHLHNILKKVVDYVGKCFVQRWGNSIIFKKPLSEQ